MSFAYESLLFTVLNIKTMSFKVPEVPKKVPEKKVPEKKVLVPKKEVVPPAKGTLGQIFDVLVLLRESFSQLFSFIFWIYIFIFAVLKKNESLKIDALSGKAVLEEKISVAFHKEEVVKERAELEIVEVQVEETLEEEEFHEVEEFLKVEEYREAEEMHRVEEVHRVIEVLEAEEEEVYEKPKAPPKGIQNCTDITNMLP